VIICWKKHFTSVGGFDKRLELRENSELIAAETLWWLSLYWSNRRTTSMRRYDSARVKHIVWLWIKLCFYRCQRFTTSEV